MAAVEIPIVPDLPHFDFQVELDAITYTLELRWNERDEAWYLSVLTAEEEPLLLGRKVVVGAPLWARFRTAGLPPGDVVAVDTQGTDTDPGLEDLGRRVRLIYTPFADAAAL